MCSTIRQLEERVVANEITLMRWSDRMDLLALTNKKGEIYLHRLTWQRVWSLPSRTDGSPVVDIAWRPDGKIISIAYACGQVVLLEVENKNILHGINVEEEITCMVWQQAKSKTQSDNDDTIPASSNMGDSTKYLPNLPSLSTDFCPLARDLAENLIHKNFVKTQNELNILIVGTKSGLLRISIFGLFTCGCVDVSQIVGKTCAILNIHMSENMNLLYLTLCDNNNNLCVSVFDTSILYSHSTELFTLALRYGCFVSMLFYLENTMSSISQAWESILLEMDSKLNKYASIVPEGTVSADFLDLLMFGIPSDEMEEFLMQDLTDKGLKKLGQSIELSYSNIQKLLHKHLTRVGQSVTYHLSELRGMARLTYRFQKLGLREEVITAALKENAAFMAKGIEVQQVINQSMTNYKAFFRWLYVVILRMMDEQIPPEVPKMAQQDLVYIVEFLQNFDNIGKKCTSQKSRFNLERLGQYLLDAPLKIPPETQNNLWYNFLEENECIANDPSIIAQNKTKSLVQVNNSFVKSVEEIFSEPKELIADSFKLKMDFSCLQISNIKNLSMTQLNYNENITLIAFVDIDLLTDGVFILQIDHSSDLKISCAYLYSSQVPEQSVEDSSYGACKILDVKFYSTTYMSLLLQDIDNDVSYICQTPIASLTPNMTEISIHRDRFILDPEIGKIDIYDIGSIIIKKIEGMLAAKFSVSGSRHVSVVLSDNRRKVQLYEMEADDEEEDLDETYQTANTTRDDSMLQESVSVE